MTTAGGRGPSELEAGATVLVVRLAVQIGALAANHAFERMRVFA